MNIYLLKQRDREFGCESIVVVASSVQEAVLLHPLHPNTIWQPCPGFWCQPPNDHVPEDEYRSVWANSPESVDIELIGKADTKFTEAAVLHKSWINEG